MSDSCAGWKHWHFATAVANNAIIVTELLYVFHYSSANRLLVMYVLFLYTMVLLCAMEVESGRALL